MWGRNAAEERVLITLELLMDRNVVQLQTFDEKAISDEVHNNFMEKWRKGEEAELPAPTATQDRELTVAGDLLPEDLKVEGDDVLTRAQTEWHYAVLSNKLSQSYQAELSEIEDRIERTTKYESDLWNQLKTFWEKAQNQLRDRTLLREHGNDIRKRTDKLFNKMKEMRSKLDDEFKEGSQERMEEMNEKLAELEAKIEEGTHLRRVFDELRQVQSKFHNLKFTKDHRNKLWKRMDKAFKDVKAARNGGKSDGGGGGGNKGRTEARLEGLLKAIEKMERSIGRDENDLKFEHRRIERTDGQLEAQIRQAKIQMIQSRVDSKQVKLEDMYKTRDQLNERVAKEAERRAEDERKAEEAKIRKAAQEEAKAKIAAEAKAREENMTDEERAKLEEAARMLSGKPKQEAAAEQPAAAQPSSPADTPAKQAADVAGAAAALVGGVAAATAPLKRPRQRT